MATVNDLEEFLKLDIMSVFPFLAQGGDPYVYAGQQKAPYHGESTTIWIHQLTTDDVNTAQKALSHSFELVIDLPGQDDPEESGRTDHIREIRQAFVDAYNNHPERFRANVTTAVIDHTKCYQTDAIDVGDDPSRERQMIMALEIGEYFT